MSFLHLQGMSCFLQTLSQSFPHAIKPSVHWVWHQKWEISLALELGQLDSSPVFTTSFCVTLRKVLYLVHISISFSKGSDKIILCPPHRCVRMGTGGERRKEIKLTEWLLQATQYLIFIIILQSGIFYFLPIR